MKKITTIQAIEWLVDDDIDTIEHSIKEGDYEHLDNILKKGFVGYERFTKRELIEELEERCDGPFEFIG